MLLLASLLALMDVVQAAPSISLPINAQVPPVARTSRPFNFVFSNSTFVSSGGIINYAASDCPSWLQFNGPSRTFSGTPAAQDTGSFSVDLVATDDNGSTSMAVILIVSTGVGPGLGTPVAKQLAANVGFASPDSLRFGQSCAFSISFSSNTFTNTDENTIYYAFCANGTPLPAWLTFDPTNLSFSGITPQATSAVMYPQIFAIDLIASDVRGFSGAVGSFQIVLESHILAFGSSVNIFNSTAGSTLNSSALQADLMLDGRSIKPSELSNVSATAPPWLQIDRHTLILSGTPPEGLGPQNFTVNATDIYGDSAATFVLIQAQNETSKSLLHPISNENATVGTEFSYNLSRSVSSADARLTVSFGKASSWLIYDPSSFEVRGHIPEGTEPQQILIDVTANEGSQFQSQNFTINVQNPAKASSSIENAAQPSGQGNHGQTLTSSNGKNTKIGRHWIAAAVILPAVTSLALLWLLYCLCGRERRKRKRHRSREFLRFCIHMPEKEVMTKTHLTFSQKIHPKLGSDNDIRPEDVPTEMSGALNAGQKRASSRISKPPRIEKLWSSRPMKRYSTGKASAGDPNQQRGRESWQSIFKELNYMPPRATEMPGSNIGHRKAGEKKGNTTSYNLKRSLSDSHEPSDDMEPSPTKRLSKRMKPRSSFSSSGLFSSSQRVGGYGHGRSVSSQGSSAIVWGSKGIGHGDGGLVGGPVGHGAVRTSWRSYLNHKSTLAGEVSWTKNADGGSVPHMRAPVPDPRRDDKLGQATRMFELSDTAANLPTTIRPVSSLPRRQTGAGARSRRNFESARLRLREREASGPLEAFHHDRARQRNSPNPLFSAGPSSSRVSSRLFTKPAYIPTSYSKTSLRNRVSPKRRSNGAINFEPSTPRRKKTSSIYSQASSLDPPSTTSLSRARASPSRRKTGNLSATPLRTTLINRLPTPMTDDGDPRYEDIDSSEYFTDELQEDTDEEGIRRWSSVHFKPPDALKINKSHDADERARKLAEDLASGRFSGSSLQRLSYLKAQEEGKEGKEEEEEEEEEGEEEELDNVLQGRSIHIRKIRIGSTKGKRLDQRLGLGQEDPGNKSFKGSIRDVENSSFL